MGAPGHEEGGKGEKTLIELLEEGGDLISAEVERMSESPIP